MKRFFSLAFASISLFTVINCSSIPQNSQEIVKQSWKHYQYAFIRDGRVIRPKNNNDTVSEGQAYAMLRAVLVDDQKTFDKCLAWTEKNLSRQISQGDYLLAWHFENGKVSDIKAASDADIDYAYSLILAYRQWQDDRYLTLAKKVMLSVLEHETEVINGKIYLLPWPKSENGAHDFIALNPSYYAPSHFKMFYTISQDSRWLALTDTTYDLLNRLMDSPEKLNEKGIIPDWIAIDQEGKLTVLPGKPLIYGWDAVRVPLRIAADYYLYQDIRALKVLQWFSDSFEKDFSNKIEFNAPATPYSNALFCSAVFAATEATGAKISTNVLQRLRKHIRQDEEGLYYNDITDYYINSIAWLPEYYQSKKVKVHQGLLRL